MNKYYNIFLLFLCIFSIEANSQTKLSDNLHLSSKFYHGWLLPEYNYMAYLTEKPINGISLSLEKNLKGEKLWEQVYHYPSFGISAYYGSLGNDKVFGKVFSFYPYVSLPLYQKAKFRISALTGVGLAYATEKFDLEKNYSNIAIASNFNIWFSEKIEMKYKASEKFNFLAGTAFGHFSNGNMAEPNLGLNFWTFYSGLDYYITKQTENIVKEVPDFKSGNEFAFIVAGGAKHTRRFAEKVYFAGSFSGEYRRILGYKGALGTGADFFYDASIPDEMRRAEMEEIKDIYKIKTGIHFSQELIVGNLSLIVQEGFYMGFTDKLNNKLMYNRGIIRYRISDKIFVNLAMKTNLWILDVAELGVGYYFRTK